MVKRGQMPGLLLLPVLLFWMLLPGAGMPPIQPALAAEDIDPAHAVQLQLVDGGRHGEARLAAVVLRLADGWKTYWRVPGDGGLPPRFDFSASDNVADVQVLLPAPRRFSDPLLGETIGYEKEVVFPILVRARDRSGPVRLQVKLDYGICGKVCVPMQATQGIVLPPVSASRVDDATREMVLRWLARTPLADDADVQVQGVRLLQQNDALLLEVRMNGKAATQVSDILVEGMELAVFGKPSQVSGTNEAVIFRIPVRGLAKAGDFAGKMLRLTLVLNGERAVERSVRLP